MPQRSNIYQKTIFEIEKQLAEDKICVQEMALLPDKKTGELREIDILIKGRINNKGINIAIECRDHKRVQGVDWIEALNTKFNDLPVDKKIAISSSGFTKSARKKAEQYNIITYSTNETQNWRSVFHSLPKVSCEFISPEIHAMTLLLDCSEQTLPVQNICGFEFLGQKIENNQTGRVVLADSIIKWHPDFPNKKLTTYSNITCNFPPGNLFAFDSTGLKVGVCSITVSLNWNINKSDLPMHQNYYDKTGFSFGKIKTKCGEISVVMKQEEGKQGKIEVSVNPNSK